MNISSASNAIGFIAGIISIIIWLWKLNSWFRATILRAKKDAENANHLAVQLISQATNAERRSDIYAFVILQAIKIEAQRTRGFLNMALICLTTLAVVLVTFYTSRVFEFDYSHPRVVFTGLLFIALLASLVMLFFYNAMLRRLEDGWSAGVREILDQKLDKHLSPATRPQE